MHQLNLTNHDNRDNAGLVVVFFFCDSPNHWYGAAPIECCRITAMFVHQLAAMHTGLGWRCFGNNNALINTSCGAKISRFSTATAQCECVYNPDALQLQMLLAAAAGYNEGVRTHQYVLLLQQQQ